MPKLAWTVTLCALLPWQSALADTVYRWEDDKGQVHFSDQPPADEAGVETLNYQSAPSVDAETTANNLAAMRETTDRMAADRREREAHRAALQQQAAAQATVVYYDEPYNPAVIWAGPPRHHHRPRPPWKPPMKAQPAPEPYPAKLVRRHYSSVIQRSSSRARASASIPLRSAGLRP